MTPAIIDTNRKIKECNRPGPERLLQPDSLPVVGMTITAIDLDLTVNCNLDCDYCFKEKYNKDMPLKTAQDAICWLILASMNAKKLIVNLIGGEPLLKFDLIKKLVPFGKMRAYQHHKSIHFGITTNGTIMSKEIIDFWAKWGIGFHTSIDGCPVVQDRHRHFKNGAGSSHLLEKNLPKILALRPKTTARSTLLPDTIKYLSQSFDYLFNMGYRNMAFVPGAYSKWDKASINEFKEQFRIVMNKTIELFRKGTFVRLKFFNEGCEAIATGKKPQLGMPACGAGRGMVLIDVDGDIWPCHRWSKKRESGWRLGSIYEQDFNYDARKLINRPKTAKEINSCRKCRAQLICSGGCPAEDLEDTGSIFSRHRAGCELAISLTELIEKFHNTLYAEKNPVFMNTYYKVRE